MVWQQQTQSIQDGQKLPKFHSNSGVMFPDIKVDLWMPWLALVSGILFAPNLVATYFEMAQHSGKWFLSFGDFLCTDSTQVLDSFVSSGAGATIIWLILSDNFTLSCSLLLTASQVLEGGAMFTLFSTPEVAFVSSSTLEVLLFLLWLIAMPWSGSPLLPLMRRMCFMIFSMAGWLVKRRQRSMAQACTEARGAPGISPWSTENRTRTRMLREKTRFRLENEIKLEIVAWWLPVWWLPAWDWLVGFLVCATSSEVSMEMQVKMVAGI